MSLGVTTVGNATVIVYDGDQPVLVTDPWMGGDDHAYFGSWNLQHEIPPQQRDDILRSRAVWLSHAHPDHANPLSLERFRGQRILLPDHYGGRVRRDLVEQGFGVEVLADREWIDISPNVRILCATSPIQDAMLLLDVGGRLFVNLNDSGGRGAEKLIKATARSYEHSYLLTISGHGEADMTNFYDEDGHKIAPPPMHSDKGIGWGTSHHAQTLGLNHVVPFSSMHIFQREDSAWANAKNTPLEDYREGFQDQLATYVPPYSHIDCVSGEITTLQPAEIPLHIQPPEAFGDNWSDELDSADQQALRDYFQRKQCLHDIYGFLRFKVGGRVSEIPLEGPSDRGVTFEAPRESLMTAVRYEIFDDLLIGNFVKTTLHGVASLYDPNFNFVVTKYADNGLAQTREEVARYLAFYEQRIETRKFVERFVDSAHGLVQGALREDSALYRASRQIYRAIRA